MEGGAADPNEVLGPQHTVLVNVIPYTTVHVQCLLGCTSGCDPDQRRYFLKALSLGWETSK